MEGILDDLPTDPVDALEMLCLRFEDRDEKIELAITDKRERDSKVQFYNQYIAALAAYEAFISVNSLIAPQASQHPTLSGVPREDIIAICNMFDDAYHLSKEIKGKQLLEEHKNRFLGVLGTRFTYHFSDNEVSRLQILINELREHIRKSKEIERNHKDRLLSRLEKLQSEVHKQVSDLDRFWGMVGDAGVVIKKLGEDAKPIVNRVTELMNIVWKAQAKAEGLPSDASNPVLRDESRS